MRKVTRKILVPLLPLLLFQLTACASNPGPFRSGTPVTVTMEQLVGQAFQKGTGEGDWYYPDSRTRPHVHLNAPGTYSRGVAKPVLFISISWGAGGGQNLAQCEEDYISDVYEYNLDTPGINWGPDEAGFQKVLRALKVAWGCD